MSMQQVKELDETFNNNYETIMKSARTLCKSYTNDFVTDVVHNVYLKLRAKVLKDGFRGKNYSGYIWMSIRNEYRLDFNANKRSKTSNYDSDDDDYMKVIENTLMEINIEIMDSQQYDIELMDVSEKLFNFINRRFDEKEVYLFKNYYLITKSTYKKLSSRTGYSIPECSITIKNMKKVIRKEFIPWLLNKN